MSRKRPAESQIPAIPPAQPQQPQTFSTNIEAQYSEVPLCEFSRHLMEELNGKRSYILLQRIETVLSQPNSIKPHHTNPPSKKWVYHEKAGKPSLLLIVAHDQTPPVVVSAYVPP